MKIVLYLGGKDTAEHSGSPTGHAAIRSELLLTLTTLRRWFDDAADCVVRPNLQYYSSIAEAMDGSVRTIAVHRFAALRSDTSGSMMSCKLNAAEFRDNRK